MPTHTKQVETTCTFAVEGTLTETAVEDIERFVHIYFNQVDCLREVSDFEWTVNVYDLDDPQSQPRTPKGEVPNA